MTARLVDLSHRVEMGMFTHPGLPGPTWEAFRSREQYRESSGTDFQVDRVTLVGNTGTYLDSPFHRFADGGSERGVGPDVLAGALDAAGDAVTGAAVLLHTGGDRAWGGEDYARDAPFLTGDGAGWLVERRAALVGIDAVNIDDLEDASRPAHTRLLAAGVLILEHLTGLADLPDSGARLHAAPPAWSGVGTWPVRAYALVG